MIFGIGNDIINIERINKSMDYLEHFMQKICGPDELKELETNTPKTQKELASDLAKLYAGKEAFSKALGTGFRDGIFLKDIQILHNDLGKPELLIKGTALTQLRKSAPNAKAFISLSDDYPYATAVVVIEQR